MPKIVEVEGAAFGYCCILSMLLSTFLLLYIPVNSHDVLVPEYFLVVLHFLRNIDMVPKKSLAHYFAVTEIKSVQIPVTSRSSHKCYNKPK